jgi:endonuclease G
MAKNLDYSDLSATLRRFQRRSSEIETTKRLVASGRGEDAETAERRAIYQAREHLAAQREMEFGRMPLKNPGFGNERVLDRRDILSIEFLEAGQIASRSVGRVHVHETGTGFLIGKDLMMTNHHVLPVANFAVGGVLELDAEENRIGAAKSPQAFSLDPERFFLHDKDHDMAIVAVSPFSDRGVPLKDYGFLPIIEKVGKIRVGDPVGIIQHPGGGLKSVVVHNSHFLYLEQEEGIDRFCWYSSDTEPGSSGSPVLNSRWEVVALHHKSVPKTNEQGDFVNRNGDIIPRDELKDREAEVQWIANEGIRASRLAQIIKQAKIDDVAQSKIRDDLLALWKQPGVNLIAQEAVQSSRSRSRAQPSRDSAPLSQVVRSTPGRFELPLRLIVELGDGSDE